MPLARPGRQPQFLGNPPGVNPARGNPPREFSPKRDNQARIYGWEKKTVATCRTRVTTGVFQQRYWKRTLFLGRRKYFERANLAWEKFGGIIPPKGRMEKF